jgi:hypothetical protein
MKIKMTREEYNKLKEEHKKDKVENPIKQKKPMAYFRFEKRGEMNKSTKKSDTVLVFLINLKKQIEGPIVAKIYGGNFMVIRNHVYRFNPDRVLSFGKFKAVIAREFDRELVGIDDYEDLIFQDFSSNNPGGRVNIDDPVLIKALIAAKLTEKPMANVGSSKIIIIAIVLIGIVVGFFLLTGKKGGAVTPPTAQ